MRVLLLFPVFLAFELAASPLEPNILGEDAAWYVHINGEALRRTALGEKLIERISVEADEPVVGEVLRGLEALTAFGDGGERYSARLAGDFPGDLPRRMQGLLVMADEYRIDDDGARKVHVFSGLENLPAENREHYAVFEDDVVIASSYRSGLARFFERTLPGSRPEALLILQADRSLLQAGMNAHNDAPWDSDFMRHVEQVGLVVADDGGEAHFEVQVRAKGPQYAEAMQQLILGLVSLRRLAGEEHEPIDDLLPLLRTEAAGDIFRMEMTVDLDVLAELAD